MDDLTGLRHLVGAYLNEDVFDFYVDVEAAVDDFVAEAPTDARGLPDEIHSLLSGSPSEEDLRHLLSSGMGLGFTPSEAEGGYRGWLMEVSRRVAAATAEPDASP